MSIPVVDVFAGPGGLGEGFANHKTSHGRAAFDIVLSIEKEKHAHSTLTLRKVVRSVGQPAIAEAFRLASAGLQADGLRDVFPRAYVDARGRALQLELGPETKVAVDAVRGRLRRSDPWVLIGGPPCQAYSLVGRARRRGMLDYVPEMDERQTLYLEYLQLLADCEPAVFVMENVKGLLSAMFAAQRLFSRIADDLANPAIALKREGRNARGRPRYNLYALDSAGLKLSSDPRDFIVRAERHGVPQARHRVIIIGVRDGIAPPAVSVRQAECSVATVRHALQDLPRIRSGISRQLDAPMIWRDFVQSIAHCKWKERLPAEVRNEIVRSAKRVVVPRHGRGAEAIQSDGGTFLFNHSGRSHIPSDLERYLFAASYAKVVGRSPSLHDFPTDLLPEHRNVRRSLESGTFADRFRVQLPDAPSTTVTSHIAKDGHYYIHYDAGQCRSLTVREAARLQSFPDDYIFTGPRTAQYLQVGNAVPPRLAEQIAAVVHAILA